MGRGRPPATPAELRPVDRIEPTKRLSATERESWERWVAVLRSTRQFFPTDAPLLTFVVELDIRKQRAAEALEREGHYHEGRRHPALTDMDNAHRDLMALLRELGLTAASAKNVKSSPRSAEADALTDFLKPGTKQEGNA